MPYDLISTVVPCEETRFRLCKAGALEVVDRIASGGAWQASEGGRPTLNRKQTEATVRAALCGQNVFVTGSAGTGKTVVLQCIVQHMRARLADEERYVEVGRAEQMSSAFRAEVLVRPVVVAAPTGAAARHAGGRTLHSLFSLRRCSQSAVARNGGSRLFWKTTGVAAEWAEEGDSCSEEDEVESGDVTVMVLSQRLRVQIKRLKVLVIDEVSMVSSDLLNLIDQGFRHCRGALHLAFGGVQVVVVGDFYQLPPVVSGRGGTESDHAYAFASPAWKKARFRVVELTQVLRQSPMQDQFLAILARARTGELTLEDSRYLAAHSRRDTSDAPDALFFTNRRVDERNEKMLRLEPNPDVVIKADDDLMVGDERWTGAWPAWVKHPRSAPPSITLKVGARVKCTHNVYIEGEDDFIANGDLGVVTGLQNGAVHVLWDNHFSGKPRLLAKRISKRKLPRPIQGKKAVVVRRLPPLKLAYARTFHAAQGSSIDGDLDMDTSALSRPLGNGQWHTTPGIVYVALSRARRLDRIRFTSRQWFGVVNKVCCVASKAVKQFYAQSAAEGDISEPFWLGAA